MKAVSCLSGSRNCPTMNSFFQRFNPSLPESLQSGAAKSVNTTCLNSDPLAMLFSGLSACGFLPPCMKIFFGMYLGRRLCSQSDFAATLQHKSRGNLRCSDVLDFFPICMHVRLVPSYPVRVLDEPPDTPRFATVVVAGNRSFCSCYGIYFSLALVAMPHGDVKATNLKTDIFSRNALLFSFV
jgi:hypothetical protein